jgi:transcriptional regulator with XRE-family HTH domain
MSAQATRRRRSDSERDPAAGQLLERLRLRAGVSRRELPAAMMDRGIKRDRIPSPSTIYMIEARGVRPHARTMAALAEFHGRDVDSIWKIPTRREVAA